MAEPTETPSHPAQSGDSYVSPGFNNVTLIYALYLAGLLIPFVTLVGVVFAYIGRGKAGEEVDSHYMFQIRTFWVGFLVVFVGVLLSVVLIGFALLLAFAVWLIIRCVKGLAASSARKPIPNPQTYLF